jgi:hypothetical protein
LEPAICGLGRCAHLARDRRDLQRIAVELPGAGDNFDDYRLFNLVAVVGSLQESDSSPPDCDVEQHRRYIDGCSSILRVHRRVGLSYPESGHRNLLHHIVSRFAVPRHHVAGGVVGALLRDQFLPPLVQLEAQATRAQLAMLRYQLNPHFLFNTLNSISTLVLLRQTEPANAMLSRLSSFLRHTLVNEVHSRVTLAQEVEMLHLYLDIEKMRFEERLRSHFDIDPAVRDALLPSLLLQPLVENAIKYAVTPQEEGADISVSAHLDGGKLRITVSDTGPGKNGPATREFDSTGVGLGNIQERLNQAYGETAIFETRSSPGKGFSVYIALPFETREQIEREAADDSATDEQVRNETIFGEHASSDAHQREPANTPAMASFQHKDLKT